MDAGKYFGPYRVTPKKSVLLDPNNPKYYNKLHKHDAWEDAAKAMGTVSEECKNKTSRLLDSFRRQRRRIRNQPWYRKGYVCPTVIVTNRNVVEVFRNEKYY